MAVVRTMTNEKMNSGMKWRNRAKVAVRTMMNEKTNSGMRWRNRVMVEVRIMMNEKTKSGTRWKKRTMVTVRTMMNENTKKSGTRWRKRATVAVRMMMNEKTKGSIIGHFRFSHQLLSKVKYGVHWVLVSVHLGSQYRRRVMTIPKVLKPLQKISQTPMKALLNRYS